MKTFKQTILLVFVTVLTSFSAQAQDDNFQAFLVHEDQVKPSKTSEYEAISKEFNEDCKKHNFEGTWNVAQTSNGKFLSISAIKNLGDIDNFSMVPLVEKIGKEKFASYFNRYDKCYDKHGSYVVLRNNDLSYMPDGMSTTQEGQDYRKWHYIYVTPENRSDMVKKLKAVKDLFVNKNSKVHYRIYTKGFGQMEDYFLVVVSAKNAEDYAKKSSENRTLLGKESKAVFDAVFNLASRYEEVTGSMRPDLSYSFTAKK
ncbi:hypothetical protein [Ichthyenterobacterium magnum]|uniref:Uncharacterized protein n=1 Tax=Ichthyenterobacterium magnum TaxID=1230530 RepID=A0A420DEL5_9FLAO|nr:hypothetical protein [Ichthyenterobacterium magnum]RKE90858.1 hypothetical protein BXY80_2701 [Ichthyenterobacterium magnum]